MKILFLTYGNENVASSRTRVYQYLPHFKINNIKTKVFIHNPFVYKQTFITGRLLYYYSILRLFLFLLLSLFFKNIFLQKVILPKWAILFLFYFKKRIIYDFDDAIYIQDNNEQLNPKLLENLNFTLSKSDLIIVENDENKNYANQFCKNVILITGPIDCSRYFPNKINKTGNIITIGWIGSPSTTKYLLLIKDVIIELKAKYGEKINFITIGADESKINELPIINYKWQLETEVNLLQQFDIGIMPLPDDIWSKGKGGYKLLQYMAIGIPSVASPVGINCELLGFNNGFLANGNEEWKQNLILLIDNSVTRENLGENALTIVRNKYSFEVNTPILLKYLNK